MQLPTSTFVSDPCLAAMPQPAPLGAVPAELAAPASGNTGGFEALIAQLAPAETPRPGIPVPAPGAARRTPALVAAASAPLGRANVASFFGVETSLAEADTAELEGLKETPARAEERETFKANSSSTGAELPLPLVAAMPPMVVAICDQKPAEPEPTTTESISSPSTEAPALFPAPRGGPRGSAHAADVYSRNGDKVAKDPQAPSAQPENPGFARTQEIRFERPAGQRFGLDETKWKQSAPANLVAEEAAGAAKGESADAPTGEAVGSATAEATGGMRSTGWERAATAITRALEGPAGENAAGVPFTGVQKSNSLSPVDAEPAARVRGETNPSLNEKGRDLRAVRAAAAKFAARESDAPVERSADSKVADKNFLTADKEYFALEDKTLGTAIANLEASMISRFTSNAPSHPGLDSVGERTAAAASPELAAGTVASADVAVSSAHEAVEAVLHATDRIASREQRSVDLTFSVGDANLAVRVELHGEEVRTSFRTDSPELQAALADEWQARGSLGDTNLRFAPPVITGSDSSGSPDSSGRSPQQQQQQQEREARRLDFASEFGRREPVRAEPTTVPATLPSPLSLRTSHRLLSFA